MNMPKIVGMSVLLASAALARTLPAQSLVHLWAFDESLGFTNNFADSSGNNQHGVGAGDIVSGRFGNAVRLLPASDPATGGIGDGVDFVDPTPEDSLLPIGAADSWTINMWTSFATEPGSLEYLGGFGIDDGEADGNAHRARSVITFQNTAVPTNGSFHFWGASVDLDAAVAFPVDSQWHMSTVTYNGASTELAMYFDGIRVASQIFGGSGPFADAPAEVHAGNPSNWNEEFDGSIDELGIWNGALTPAQIGGLFVHNDAQQPQELQPTAVVNRATGHVTLSNLTPSDVGNLSGYEITSAAGSLDPAAWVTITGHLDQGQGTMPIDSGPWSVTTSTDLTLAESDQGAPRGVFHASQAIDLGAIWTKSTYEDLVVKLKTDDGTTQKTLDVLVSYSGDSLLRSDLDGNGELNLQDWRLFATNGFANLNGLSRVDAALRGDLDGDGDSDRQDFRLFRTDYVAAHGEAAFAALTAVPEPSTAVGMIFLGAVVIGLRRRR